MSEASARRRPSIRDVANAAGVSLGTVSHALNGSGRVSAATRERIKKHAEELGYRANPSARNMRSASTGLMAIVSRVDTQSSWMANDLEFLSRITQQICASAWALGYFPTLLPSDVSAATVASLPLDGLIIIDPFRDDELLSEIDSSVLPFVCVSPESESARDGSFSWVDTDTRSAMVSVLDSVHATGVQNAALISIDGRQSYLLEPIRAFEDWTRSSGISGRSILFPADAGHDDCYRAVYEACTGDSPVDLLYVVTEAFIQTVLTAVADAGLRIPEDVQVIAASDSAHGRNAVPPITSLDLVPEEVGAAAMELLHGTIAGEEVAGTSRLIDAVVRLRGSTRLDSGRRPRPRAETRARR